MISDKRKKELNNDLNIIIVGGLHRMCLLKNGKLDKEECIGRMWVMRCIYGSRGIIPHRVTTFKTISEMAYVAKICGIV